MHQGQVFAKLIAIQKQHPETTDVVDAVMKYVTELGVVAGLATETLSMAARELPDHRIVAHNAGLIEDRLAALMPPVVSHGGDL
jgi:hypothetical protein